MATTPSLYNTKTLQAIFLGLGAFLVYALNDVCTKMTGKASVPFAQMIVTASCGALPFLIIGSFFRGGLATLKPNNMKLQVPMCALTVAMGFVSAATFTQLPLTTVYTALFTSPMITALLAMGFMKESLGKKQMGCIIVGFCGAVFAVNPLDADFQGSSALGWMLLPIYPVFFSLNVLLSRALRKTTSPDGIAFAPTFVRAIFVLPIALYGWQPMETWQVLLLMSGGALVSIGNLMFSTALAKAESAIIAPLHYSQLIYGAFFGYVLWNDFPAWHTIAGATVVVVAGIVGARLVSRTEQARDINENLVPSPAEP